MREYIEYIYKAFPSCGYGSSLNRQEHQLAGGETAVPSLMI